MILDRIIDPRDSLEKARRAELENYARANGVGEIDPNMPAQLMRRILRSKGLTNIAVAAPPLGAVSARPFASNPTQMPQGDGETAAEPEAVAEVTAEENLARQWKTRFGAVQEGASVSSPLPKGARDYGAAEKSIEDMSFAELRAACKARGIKTARTDKASDLRGKLSGQDTA